MADKEEKKEKSSEESKELKKEKKPGRGRGFLVIIIIALLILIVGYYFYDQSKISALNDQISKLKQDNSNMNSQITGYSVQVDALKNFSSGVLIGEVPFWEENGSEIISASVPMNSYTARVFGEKVIKNSGAFNLIFKSDSLSGKLWTVNFVCSDKPDNCGAQVFIDEGAKSYRLVLND